MANILLYAYNVYLNNHYMYTMVIRTLLTVLGGTSVSIEGGGRVEVGENVNIICLCTGDLKCISHPVVFRISGRDYTYSQLGGSVLQYSIRYGGLSLHKQEVILTLTQATLDNDGTTYECKIFPDSWDQANVVTLSVIGESLKCFICTVYSIHIHF